jgi:hypothetical protein
VEDNLFTESKRQYCPYCGEPITLIIEPLDETQTYTDDCEVCCRPMIVTVSSLGDVSVQREDD